MAQFPITLTANTSGTGTFVCNVIRKPEYYQYFFSLWAEGTFGGGTLTWYASRNGGTTVVPLTDLTDAAISMTAAKIYNGAINTGKTNNDKISIWVQLSGATSPNITAVVIDNN